MYGHRVIWCFWKFKQNFQNNVQIWEELAWSFGVSGHFKLEIVKNNIHGSEEC